MKRRNLALAAVALLSSASAQAAKPKLIFPFASTEGWKITTGYGGSSTHQGTDFYALDFSLPGDADRGKPILAAASGMVDHVAYNAGGYGNYIDLDHGDGYVTRYAHLESLPSLLVGTRVEQGQHVGQCGDTGNADGVHLHFVLYRRVNNVLTAQVPEPMAGFTGLQETEVFGVAATTLVLEPGAPPYYPGQQVIGRFTVTNYCSRTFDIDTLTVGGRGPGGPDDVEDFQFDTTVPALTTGASYPYQGTKTFPTAGQYRFSTAYKIDGSWYTLPKDQGDLNLATPRVSENLALNKVVQVWTNGAEGSSGGHPGEWPADIVDGDLSYQPVSSGQPDGCIAWHNPDSNELLRVRVAIDLGQMATVTRIRYNMGNCQHADTWGADIFQSPFGRTPTVPGGSYAGAWTTQDGLRTDGALEFYCEKTRVSSVTDWLFIGEIEVYGTTQSAQAVATATILGTNNQHTAPIEAIGAPNGAFVSLGVGGEVVLDLGEGATLTDRPGNDLRIYAVPEAASTTSPMLSTLLDEGYALAGSTDGFAWTSLGAGVGTQEFDIAAAGLTTLRYLRVTDDGDGNSLSTRPGLDLDGLATEWSTVVGVEDRNGREGLGLRLEPLFPNPLVRSSTIAFALSEWPGRLAVYDVRGQLVRVLGEHLLPTPRRLATWDGRDNRGRMVAAGVYLVRLEARGEQRVQKVTVTR